MIPAVIKYLDIFSLWLIQYGVDREYLVWSPKEWDPAEKGRFVSQTTRQQATNKSNEIGKAYLSDPTRKTYREGYTIVMNDLEERYTRQFIDGVCACSGPPHAWAKNFLISKLGGTFKVAFTQLPHKWKQAGVKKCILKLPFTN